MITMYNWWSQGITTIHKLLLLQVSSIKCKVSGIQCFVLIVMCQVSYLRCILSSVQDKVNCTRYIVANTFYIIMCQVPQEFSLKFLFVFCLETVNSVYTYFLFLFTPICPYYNQFCFSWSMYCIFGFINKKRQRKHI